MWPTTDSESTAAVAAETAVAEPERMARGNGYIPGQQRAQPMSEARHTDIWRDALPGLARTYDGEAERESVTAEGETSWTVTFRSLHAATSFAWIVADDVQRVELNEPAPSLWGSVSLTVTA